MRMRGNAIRSVRSQSKFSEFTRPESLNMISVQIRQIISNLAKLLQFWFQYEITWKNFLPLTDNNCKMFASWSGHYKIYNDAEATSRLKSCRLVLWSPSEGSATANVSRCQVDLMTVNVAARQVDSVAPTTEALKRKPSNTATQSQCQTNDKYLPILS